MHLRTRVHRCGQCLGAVLFPPHRHAGDAGQQRNEALLAEEVLLVAEPPAHVGGDHPHRRLGHAAHLGHHGAQLVGLLRRHHHRQELGSGVVLGLGPVTFERQPHDAVALEPLPQHVGCRGDGVGEVRTRRLEVQQLVGAPLGIEQRCVGGEGPCGIDDRRERLQVELDQLQRVFGHGPAHRDDRGHRFTREAHAVRRQDRPLERLHARHLEEVAHPLRTRGVEVGLRVHAHDARQRRRHGGVDAPDHRVRGGAAQERDMMQAVDVVVGEIAAAPGEEPRVLLAQATGPDHRVSLTCRRRSTHPPAGIRPARAAATR